MFNKPTKKIICMSAAAMCLISSLRVAPFFGFQADAADALSAAQITENMKLGWNLGNTMDATVSGDTATVASETAWGNPKASQAMMDAVKAKGFNTVRIPTTWFQHISADGKIDPEWMARVKEIVDYCIKDDMYVILNVHHENWVNRADLGTAYDEMHAKLMNIWTQIANEFKDYDQHLIFECMNEPRAAGTTHEWWGPEQSEIDTINKLNADFVKLIRSIDSPYKDTRLLMIPGYCASSDISILSKIDVPKDDYVAVSVHAYSPYSFAMQFADDKGNEIDHSTYTKAYSAELQSILAGVRKTFTDKDIPVVIGEFSASNYDNTEARCEWATDFITTTKKYGIPCVLWDNDARGNKDKSERHDYLNRKELTWYEDSGKVIDTMVNILEDSSIVWGSEAKVPVVTHDDITTGKEILGKEVKLDASVKDGNCTPGLNATWSDLKDGEVAVKFTGDAPVVAVVDDAWDRWTEIKPYEIDETNGIAYYTGESIGNAWNGDPEEIAHLFARTNSKTTITNIAILGAPQGEIVVPEDKTKKYQVKFDQSDRTATMVITFKGEAAGKGSNGCVGYMGAEDWEQVEWEGKSDANGVTVVEIPLEKIPANVTGGEVQIWWSDDDTIEFKSLEYKTAAVTTTTTEPATTTTTAAETTVTTTETTAATTETTTEPVTTTTETTAEVPATTTTVTTVEFLLGDANSDGDVTPADAVTILQFLGNRDKYDLTEDQKKAADVYNVGDGVTALDALAIQKLDAGVVTSLPIND